jgi:hypothetical protein
MSGESELLACDLLAVRDVGLVVVVLTGQLPAAFVGRVGTRTYYKKDDLPPDILGEIRPCPSKLGGSRSNRA